MVGATSSNSSGNTDVYLLKVDSLCNYEWSFALGGANNDWGYSVKQTFDKGFIIAASSNSYGNGGYDALLMKRDSLGNFVWQKKYGGQDWDFAYSVAQTFDSGYVFCGETYNNTSGFSDVYVVKTNPLGDTLWTKTIGASLIDKGNCVIETSDSNIVVAGLTNTIADSTQAYVIKLNQNGVLLWDSAYGGALYDDANAIIETVNGEYVTAGSSTNFNVLGDLDFYLLRLNNNGGLIWENVHGTIGSEEAFGLVEDSNGNLIIVGYTKSTTGGGMKDAQLFYVTSGGWWGAQGSTFGAAMDEEAKSIVFGKNGSMNMAGYTNSFGQGLDDVLIMDVDTVVPNHQFTVDQNDVLPPVGVLVYSEKKANLVYPNPASTYLTYVGDSDIDRCRIADLTGKTVIEKELSFVTSIDLSFLSEGAYIVLFYKNGKEVGVQKLIISR